MNKKELIERLQSSGKWVKVRIDADGRATGMLAEENYKYNARTNTGGRRFIGYVNELIVDFNTLSNY
jgi:hypothetical protein